MSCTKEEYEILYLCEDCRLDGECIKEKAKIHKASLCCITFRPKKGWINNILFKELVVNER